uniref:Pre-B-cell leukemia homeobox interacting protein 1a n=2 Tax=Gasterosteus aculeatus TaxID=69293 RepID=A0AAQ4RPC1_GASAC|nr:pre-B-cell leukemia transcription factor-interacting protein 1 isoform X1 [Gasterosteus aculeatus aculeatus]XP_040044391.1 pre-B-cell leukemia transcription factor-interacting protein 1 isoform X1 [Gasterosteus aculeatus aculeatus]XP_040044392.1 pre-B-cell leukemia transcription factor-interacting protein 1 isoform X1 [Gasterosteus aculeatus aculeatus]
MSDSSNSTGSSGSSSNSWTLLSPEEAAVENVGPVDDGTESLGDAPSLSEDVTGAASSDIPVETVLSEEGHQVCQETDPESSEGLVPSSLLTPTLLDPPEPDLESQPPVIHDIVTSSPSDNEHLEATPFVTNIDSGALLDVPADDLAADEPEEPRSAPPLAEMPGDTEQVPDPDADLVPGPVYTTEPEVHVPTETLTATDPASRVDSGISSVPESTGPPSRVPESLGRQSPVHQSPTPHTVGSVEEEEKEGAVEEEEEAVDEKEEVELSETVNQHEGEEEEEEEEEGEEPSSGFDLGDTGGFDDGPRRRNAPSFESPRPRTSDDDDEEELEFKLAEKKKGEETPWFSLNKCIVGSLILLFLGSLFLSGDFDASELGDGEQIQGWLSGDPQDMKELLDKLTQENQQIAQLEAQLQSQKEELDSALTAVAASGDEQERADLEKENVKLKEELLSLPGLKQELESLRSRVTELSKLSADHGMPPATTSSAPQPGDNAKAAGLERREDTNEGGGLKEELQRQKGLLEESKKRLQGMKKDGGDGKVRDSLEDVQKRLSEQVERWGTKKPQESKRKGKKGKSNERDHWNKEEKKEVRGEKGWKHGKEGEGRAKEEKKEKEQKSPKPNSHKEAWTKHQDEWERKKDERRMDRDERRKEKPWHSRPVKNSHHQQQQQPRQPHQHKHNDFWRHQEQKLRSNVRPQLGCSSVEDCAGREGLYPVELPEFEELLEGYLSKLQGSSSESKDKIRKLTAEFFEDGGFIHDRVLFADFAEDVADILEDMADVSQGRGHKDGDSLEEEMEEFEREALWKFAATV